MAKVRIIAEASFLQPNVLTLFVKAGSPITAVGQLRGKTVSTNAPNDIGTLLIDSPLNHQHDRQLIRLGKPGRISSGC